jgi:hypothetical protein
MNRKLVQINIINNVISHIFLLSGCVKLKNDSNKKFSVYLIFSLKISVFHFYFIFSVSVKKFQWRFQSYSHTLIYINDSFILCKKENKVDSLKYSFVTFVHVLRWKETNFTCRFTTCFFFMNFFLFFSVNMKKASLKVLFRFRVSKFSLF